MLSKIIKEWEIESKCNEPVRFSQDFKTQTLIIYSSNPGVLIGKAGWVYKKYLSKINEYMMSIKEIKFIEVQAYCEDVNKEDTFLEDFFLYENLGENWIEED